MNAPRSVAPRLVFAIGNASRGDDALGPAVAAALRDEGWFDGGPEARAELIEAYQLQLEDALELEGRRAVLFVDAARGAVGDADGVALARVAAARGSTPFTHALPPAALLEVAERVLGQAPPPAWLLAIEGESFELAAALTPAACARLPRALARARAWLAAGRGEDASQGAASAFSTQHNQPVHSV